MNRILLKSDNLDTRTPADFLRLVESIGPIAVDPCGNRRGLVNARVILYPRSGWKTRPDYGNGITANWKQLARGGLVFVNPPYGQQINFWSLKTKMEAFSGTEIILLVAARTDTCWFHHLMKAEPDPRAVIFWSGRIRFVGHRCCAPFPSAVFYWGKRRDRFLSVFGQKGFMVLRS